MSVSVITPAFGNSFGLPIEIVAMIINDYLNDADLIKLNQTSGDFDEIFKDFIPILKKNFIADNPYESLLWDNFDGTVADFVNKLQVRMVCDLNDGTLQQIASESRFFNVSGRIPENREQKFYIKMLLDVGVSIELAVIYSIEYLSNPLAIEFLLKLARKYPQFVEFNETDESGFTTALIRRFLEYNDEKLQSWFNGVDHLISIGARPSEALDLTTFYNREEVLKFISYINRGFSSEGAFKMVLEGIDPSDEKIVQFLLFKMMFDEYVAIILIFTPFVINIPDNYVYTDDDVIRMNESFVNEGPDFIYSFSIVD
jgi:hypothetical protein